MLLNDYPQFMSIAGCLQASSLCVGTDDEGEGDALEGATITAAAPALALVTIDSFRYGNNLSEGRIDKTEKVNRHLADQPCALHRSGSDGDEVFFSGMAGCGKIQNAKRNINFRDALNMV